MGELDHLRPELQNVVALSAGERIARLSADHWIGYSQANRLLSLLEELISNEPGRIRPHNMLIVGPTNNGKTMIAEKFCRGHKSRPSDDGGFEVIPVVAMQMMPEPSVSRFYSTLLAALNMPVGFNGALDRKERLSLDILRQCQTRMLIIDELHNLLSAYQRRQRELLNLLRFLGNELRIPIVCLGTKEAWLAIRTDDQLENRFRPVTLPKWRDPVELGRLLASFETLLPLRQPSHLASPALRDLILRRTEGIIGEISHLLTRSAADAISTGRERIDEELLANVDYQPPSVRRRLIERGLGS